MNLPNPANRDAAYAYAGGEDRQRITCIHCESVQEISRKALSVTCRSCGKSLRLEDVRIGKYEARRTLETCASLTIERKGQLVADKVSCGSAVIRGKTKGTITSRGPVLVGPEAEIVGDIIAPTIAIPEGAILEGRYTIGPKHAFAKPGDGVVPPAQAA